jgi:archaellum component FlaG (FlaF/FlaG flagellin family)
VRSDSSATPSLDIGNTQRLPTKPHIVRVDEVSVSDAVGLFASEFPNSDTSVVAVEPHSRVPAEQKPERASDTAAKPAAPTRFGWRNVTLALLALVVLIQGGLMAFWMTTGALAVTAPNTGSVTVTSQPSGLPVTIDGAARGASPLTLELTPGSHRIDVGAGPELRSQDLNVTRGGNASVHVELMPPVAPRAITGTGGLQVATDPAGARVFVDGEPRGISPVTVAELKVGEHLVTVRGAKGDAVNRTVSVQEATVASLIISMNTGGAYASGWLAISSRVPLQIWEKDTLVGTTDMPRILLPAGAHELELVNSALGFREARSVQVTAGQATTIALKLPMGTISINALPWAEVWIDGQRAGETPIGNLSIAIGSHDILFRHPELGEQKKTVAVGVGAPLRVGVDMKKP